MFSIVVPVSPAASHSAALSHRGDVTLGSLSLSLSLSRWLCVTLCWSRRVYPKLLVTLSSLGLCGMFRRRAERRPRESIYPKTFKAEAVCQSRRVCLLRMSLLGRDGALTEWASMCGCLDVWQLPDETERCRWILKLMIWKRILSLKTLERSSLLLSIENTRPGRFEGRLWLGGPSFNQGVGGSIPALVDVSLSKTLHPELLPVAASTVCECDGVISHFG